MPRALRMCAFAAGLAALGMAAGAPALAQTKIPEPAEARATLEKACRDDGSSEAQCSCIGEFVDTHFTDRELAGAALVFGNPLYTVDPGAGIAVLLDAGFTLEEITAVAERVIELEERASSECSLDEGSGESDAE